MALRFTHFHRPDLGLLLIRLVLATVFIYHGGQKLFGLFGGYGLTATAQWMGSIGIPFPTISAVLASSTEFFGGLLLGLGVFPRLVAIPMVFTMLVAIITVHWGKFAAGDGGMEYPLTLGVVLFSLILLGGGRFTVHQLLNRDKASQ